MPVTVDTLREAARLVYEKVGPMAGTPEAGGDFGVGAGGDVSRNIDVTAERTVMEHLERSGAPCTVLGEECGRVEIGGGGGNVVMDAVDGSANAVRGIPFFCCSLAYAAGPRLSDVTDAVVTNLATGDAYWATRGGGAFLNGGRIRVSGRDSLYSIVGANVSGAGPEVIRMLQPIFDGNGHVRHLGANALEMAMLAAGRMDAYVDLRGRIRVQDAAAGCLLVREAGGIVLDAELGQLDSDLGYATRLSFYAASSRGALDEVLARMGRPQG